MWRFINDDKRLLRKGIRTAPVIPMEKLEKICKKGRNPKYWYNQCADEVHEELISELAEYGGENNEFLQFAVLKSGIPVVLFENYGDWEQPYLYCIYWDGEKLRARIPRYGNTINAITNTPFGTDIDYLGEDNNYDKIIEEKLTSWKSSKANYLEDTIDAFECDLVDHIGEDTDDCVLLTGLYAYVCGDVPISEFDSEKYSVYNVEKILDGLNQEIVFDTK